MVTRDVFARVLFIMVSCCTSASVFAADGSSGCGPGWYIFKENSFVSSALRGTTNGILSPFVTLGMTFGTSNCAKHKLVETHKESLLFVANNMHTLRASTAMGTGEHLGALAQTLGCSWQAQASFNSQLQSSYEQIFGYKQNAPELVLGDMIESLNQNDDALKYCRGLDANV